jgi:hypothetical protein
MVTEAPTAVKAETRIRTDGSIPGQVSFGFDKCNPELVLEIAGSTKESGISLALARKIQGTLGELSDDLKLHTLAFWNSKTRGRFIRSLSTQQAYYLSLAGDRQESMKKAEVVYSLQLERLYGVERTAYLYEVERAKRADEQDIAGLKRVGTMPIVVEDIQEPPVAWVKFMGSLTPAERSMVGHTIARPIYPGQYFKNPEIFSKTLGDFRTEHQIDEIDLGGRVLGDPSPNSRARKEGVTTLAFLAVATRKTAPRT